jgi:hypothetical protein
MHGNTAPGTRRPWPNGTLFSYLGRVTALDRALTEPPLRPLPPTAVELLRDLNAPPRLAAHLRAVHDVAWSITDALGTRWPTLDFDTTAVLFGAATHDVGKVVHPAELSGPGHEHEPAGRSLLLRYGVPAHLARFAGSHGSWDDPGLGTEDLLVSLAGKVWRAKREPELEQLVADRIAITAEIPSGQAVAELDEILSGLAAGADERLAFQSAFGLPGQARS